MVFLLQLTSIQFASLYFVYIGFCLFLFYSTLTKEGDNFEIIESLNKEDFHFLSYYSKPDKKMLYKYLIFKLISNKLILISDENKGIFISNKEKYKDISQLTNLEHKIVEFYNKETDFITGYEKYAKEIQNFMESNKDQYIDREFLNKDLDKKEIINNKIAKLYSLMILVPGVIRVILEIIYKNNPTALFLQLFFGIIILFFLKYILRPKLLRYKTHNSIYYYKKRCKCLIAKCRFYKGSISELLKNDSQFSTTTHILYSYMFWGKGSKIFNDGYHYFPFNVGVPKKKLDKSMSDLDSFDFDFDIFDGDDFGDFDFDVFNGDSFDFDFSCSSCGSCGDGCGGCGDGCGD